jgi:hypothetical protein
MSKPLDKRMYKGTSPTCHDFNSVPASDDRLMLLIGFSGGQIQLLDPIYKKVNKLFNEEVSHHHSSNCFVLYKQTTIKLIQMNDFFYRESLIKHE